MNSQFWYDLLSRLGCTGRLLSESGDDPSRPRLGLSDPRVLGVAVTATSLAWLANGLFIVREGHRADVTTSGEVPVEVRPGLTWRWSTPIHKRVSVDMLQNRTEEIGFSSTAKRRTQ